MNSSRDMLSPSTTHSQIKEALAQVPTIGELRKLTITPRICGIYFLVRHGETVYVGQSKDIVARVNQHIDEHSKDFDSVLYVQCPVDLLDYYEKRLIATIRPRYNFAHARKRCGAAGLVVHALSRSPDGLTFEEILERAEEQGVWAQTRLSLEANLQRALDTNPQIRFSQSDLRYRITHPTADLCGCQNRENSADEPISPWKSGSSLGAGGLQQHEHN